jgi:hypothetical protein
MTDNPFEIPQAMRDLAEQNLKQTHTEYEQLTDLVTKATDAWTGALPSNAMTVGFKDAQDRALEFAMENADSAFTFAGQICNAQTLQDIVTLQTQFAQDRMQTFVMQSQELYNLIGETLQKLQRG